MGNSEKHALEFATTLWDCAKQCSWCSSRMENSGLNWIDSWKRAEECPECQTKVDGHYCPNCGQKQLDHRLNFFELLSDLFSRITSLESGFFFTFIQLCIRPGSVAREFVLGKQKSYTNPLGYFFLSVAAQMAVLWLFAGPMRENLAQQFRDYPDQEFVTKLNETFHGQAVEIIVDSYFSAVQQAYLYCALLFFCLPFSLMVYWGERFLGKRYTWGETTVFSLYVFGHCLFITAIVSIFTSRIDVTWQMLLTLGVMFALPQQAHTNFFPEGVIARGLTFVATLFSFALLMISITGIFVSSVAWAVASRSAG